MEEIGNIAQSVRGIVDAALPDGASRDPRVAPALSLAYVGDTVYDLYVRTLLVEREDARVHELHLASAKLVCAAGQAAAFRIIEPMLTEDELSVYRRGRNSHLGTVAKNAKISDYRTATGLEALLGFLYLSGRDRRLTELMREIIRSGR
ncbi:MAG TPA: ribonuclease III domain-containing protein [Clostridia bacterium]|nr:ribonuclease III domain-containing protein [Clostridia bacterium]